MNLKCPKCGKIWNYKGANKVTATCPDCYLKIKIQQSKVKVGGKSK